MKRAFLSFALLLTMGFYTPKAYSQECSAEKSLAENVQIFLQDPSASATSADDYPIGDLDEDCFQVLHLNYFGARDGAEYAANLQTVLALKPNSAPMRFDWLWGLLQEDWENNFRWQAMQVQRIRDSSVYQNSILGAGIGMLLMLGKSPAQMNLYFAAARSAAPLAMSALGNATARSFFNSLEVPIVPPAPADLYSPGGLLIYYNTSLWAERGERENRAVYVGVAAEGVTFLGLRFAASRGVHFLGGISRSRLLTLVTTAAIGYLAGESTGRISAYVAERDLKQALLQAREEYQRARSAPLAERRAKLDDYLTSAFLLGHYYDMDFMAALYDYDIEQDRNRAIGGIYYQGALDRVKKALENRNSRVFPAYRGGAYFDRGDNLALFDDALTQGRLPRRADEIYLLVVFDLSRDVSALEALAQRRLYRLLQDRYILEREVSRRLLAAAAEEGRRAAAAEREARGGKR